MIANDSCNRCGEDLCNSHCPKCLDKEFCQRCNSREAVHQCRDCGLVLCEEECYIVSTGGSVYCDAHKHDSEEADAAAYERMYEERRERVQS